jgi:heme-degrading monooxygenase HmoA
MIAVIFEVWPKPEHKDAYLNLAASIRTELESIDGFISIERFESITEQGKMLSLSFFEHEEGVVQWRNTAAHRKAQAIGKQKFFADYRLRIADVQRDYGPTRRDQAPADSRALHD